MSDAPTILGASPAVESLRAMIAKIAPSKTNVLVIGESGTGKELVARAIHEGGPLKGKPFVAVNCGAIPENLIESELFGHKRGSFTGAVADKPGLFEVANSGTLFLDEVGELPLGMQVKLLRAIQDRSFRRVGSNDTVKVDVRIIAATNRDLEAMIAAGRFREDLYYRLNVILIQTPALRDRPGDVLLLARKFLDRVAERNGRMGLFLSAEVEAKLTAFGWPGNVRELENVIERAVALTSTDEIPASVLPPQVLNGASDVIAPSGFALPAPDFSKGPLRLDAVLAPVERAYLEAALRASKGAIPRAAELLGMTPTEFTTRVQRAGLRK